MANLYDLKKFDLNLLVIFECIYQHLSISKAAESLYITPSAVSQSLQRLRAQFNDPLFIRSGKGIAPTTTGLNLHHSLIQFLVQFIRRVHSLLLLTAIGRFHRVQHRERPHKMQLTAGTRATDVYTIIIQQRHLTDG